jgi:SAM-dependent methyltransferase
MRLRSAAKQLLVAARRRMARVEARRDSVPAGLVRMGSLRRLRPLSTTWGFDRGTPIDRYYVDDFLGSFSLALAHEVGYARGDIQGRVLEVGGDEYVQRFGHPQDPGSPVSRVDVLHASDVNPRATIVDDLERGDNLPADAFDCILCVQTLHVIYDFRAAIRNLHRSLAPGGVLFATFPGITPACTPDRDHWGDWWRFTGGSARREFESVFQADGVHVEAYGNVLTATAFLYGMAAEELTRAELQLRDPDYEVLLAVRAVKARGDSAASL